MREDTVMKVYARLEYTENKAIPQLKSHGSVKSGVGRLEGVRVTAPA